MTKESQATEAKKPGDEINAREFADSEARYACQRFTHLEYCLCRTPPCSQIPPLVELFPAVFISTFAIMFHPHSLSDHNISHVVDLSQEQYTLRPGTITRLRLDLEDEPVLQVRLYFRRASRFMRKALEDKGGVVLIARPGSDLHLTFALGYQVTVLRAPLKDALGDLARKAPELHLSERMKSELTFEEMAMHVFA